ncbi:unnamed protein product, partial [Ectocarpus sp. 13 AM-2016]
MDSLLLSSAGEQAGAIDDELRGLTLTVSTNTGTTTAIQEGACGHRGALQGLQPEPTVASLPPGCRTGANDFMFREQQPMFPFDAVNILGANTGGGVCSGGRNQAADGRSESGTCAYSSTGVRGGKGPVFAVGSGGGAGVAADGAAGGGGDVRSKKRSASRGRGRDGLGVMSSTAKLKPRPRITSTATKPRDVATAKASLRTEADIQGVVDEIKSRNQNNGGGRQAKGGRWTAEEDDTLRNIVSRDGEGKWKEKSEELNYVMASHYEAMAAVAAAKSDHAVQQYGRAAAQCLHRWKKVLQPGLNKRHWTPEEDEIVRGTVLSAQAIGTVKWSLVAVLLPGRLGKQCRERWFNHLDPTVKKTEWTPHEDEVLFNAQAFFGTRWCEISKFLPGRTENAVKNRFNSSARQKWFSGQPQANGRPVNKKAASKAFLDRLMDTLGKDGGGGYDGNGVDGSCSGSKRIMERSAKPTQPNPFSGQLPPSALLSPSSPASKLAKRQRVQLPGLLSQQNTGFLGSSSLAGTHTGLPYTTNDTTAAAAPAAAGTRHAGFGGGTGTSAGAAVGTISTDDELSAAILTGDKREKKKQQVQKQSKRNHKRRSERAGSMVTVALRVRNSRGGKVSRHVMKNSSPHGPRLGVPAALAVPSSQHETVMGSYGKREPEAAGAAGISGTHEQHPTVGAMSCLEAQGGVRSTAPGRNNGKSAGLAGGSSAASSPSDPSAKEEHDRRSCAPWLPGSGGIPQWGSVSGGNGFSNQRYGSAEETTFAAEAIANKIKANIGREDETLTQAAAAAAVAAVKTEAAQRYLRGEWTLTSQRPLPLSCGTSIPQFHPYFELATKKHSNDSDSTTSSSFLWAAGTSDSSPSSPPVFASALGGPNSNSSRTSSTSKLSRSGAFHDCSSQKANDATPSNKTVERQTGISVNTNGSPPPLCTPELATDHNNNHITTTTNNSSSRSSSHNRAESFLEDFLLDDTNSPGLPFAPSEVLGLGRRVGLGNDSRSSSATSMMMMMMFGVGVGASGLFGGVGVSPAVADSTVHNGNNGDIRPAAMMPNNQRASSGSGDGGSSTGISSSATGSAGSGGVSSLPSSPSTVASARTTPITVPIVPRVQGQEGSPPTVWQASNEGRQAQTDPTPEPFIGSSANGHRPQGMAPLPVPFTTPVPAAGARSSPPVGEAMTALSAASPAIWTAFSSSPAVPPPFSWQGVRGPIPPSVTASTVVSGGGGGGGGADHGTGKQHQRASPGQKAVTDDAVVFPSGASGASGASLIDGQQQQQSHLPLKDQVPSAPATPHSGKGGGGGGGGIDRGCDLRSRSTASLATPSLPTGAAVGALTPGGGSGTPDGDEVNATSVDQDPDTNGGVSLHRKAQHQPPAYVRSRSPSATSRVGWTRALPHFSAGAELHRAGPHPIK